MGILAIRADERVKHIHFTEETISVDLMDGRIITVPLIWYPRLFHATPDRRANGKYVEEAMAFTGKTLMKTSVQKECCEVHRLRGLKLLINFDR